MRKKGKIPEHHRAASEEKWDNIIKAIDDGVIYAFTVNQPCGYCYHAEKTAGNWGNRCKECLMPMKICCTHLAFLSRFSLFCRVLKAVKKGRDAKARAIAVKILDYIKNDKPEEQS